jgi:hypothetical protein
MALESVHKPTTKSSSPKLEERRKQLRANTPTTKSPKSAIPRYLRGEFGESPAPAPKGRRSCPAEALERARQAQRRLPQDEDVRELLKSLQDSTVDRTSISDEKGMTPEFPHESVYSKEQKA